MHLIRQILLYLGSVTLLFVTMPSCIDEDLSECPTGVDLFIDFRYEMNIDYIDKFQSIVEQVDLFIYDANNQLVSQSVYSKTELAASAYKVKVSLPEGNYKIVSWVNFNQDYQVSSKNLISGASLLTNASATGGTNIVTPQLKAIYHGMGQVTLTKDPESLTIFLIKNTNLIHVEMEFVEAPQGNLTTLISGCNGIYDFENNKLACQLLTYMPQYRTANGGKLITADMTILRMFIGDDLRLRINNSAFGVLANVSLVDLLLRDPGCNTNEDLDRRDEYTIRFQFDPTYALVGVVINDWFRIDDPGTEL